MLSLMYLYAQYLERHFYGKENKQTCELLPVRDINLLRVEHSSSITVDSLIEIKSEFKIAVNYNSGVFKGNREF